MISYMMCIQLLYNILQKSLSEYIKLYQDEL